VDGEAEVQKDFYEPHEALGTRIVKNLTCEARHGPVKESLCESERQGAGVWNGSSCLTFSESSHGRLYV
jgi:hypothetical protein